MTIDGFYTSESAINISHAILSLDFTEEFDFGKQIPNFNMMDEENVDSMFSSVLNFKVEVDKKSGYFRIPYQFIHFEEFESSQDWLFIVALESSTFNLFEHKSGAKTALDNYKFNYRNLFEWDLKVNYLLDPGQGIFFRPWLFHSFCNGLIQIFRVKEVVDAVQT
jgi:hypothetical protein